MKVVRYEIQVCDGFMEEVHGMTSSQVRVFIPDFNVLVGFREKKRLDFLVEITDPSNSDIELVGRIYKEKLHEGEREVTNIIEFDLPEPLVRKFVEAGREMNEAREKVDELTVTLSDMMSMSLQ